MSIFSKKDFIEKAKQFRIHFDLTEQDIDFLLKKVRLKYSGLEKGKRTLTLALAEAYPLLYGIGYCDFKKAIVTFPDSNDLPQSTKDFYNSPHKSPTSGLGLRGTKHKNSYIIFAMKSYAVGDQFVNSDILSKLPAPLDQEKAIEWNKGLLKGLVKNTKEYQKHETASGTIASQAIYEVIKAVSPELLATALKNMDAAGTQAPKK